MILLELLYNMALLVAVSVISGFIRQQWKHKRTRALLQGMVFGGAAVIGMLRPMTLGPGLFFDGRSIMISLCGLFFGPLSACVAGGMAALLRLLQGGVGTVTGLLVILFSVLIGLVFYARWTRRGVIVFSWRLLWVGLMVHVVMLALMFTLPGDTKFAVFKQISLPIMLLFPAVTVMVGNMLSLQAAQGRFLTELKESEERYRSLFEMESDAILLIDNETGRILEANAAAVALYGCSHAELLASRNSDLSAEPEETQRVTRTTPISSDTVVIVPSRRHRKKDGTVFWVEITGRFFVRKGHPCHIAAIRDITARRHAEEARENLELQLRQSQKMEAVGRLAGGVAHDFNNMLQVIRGYTEMLIADLAPGDPHAGDLAEINKAAKRSADLTRQLLAFARKQTIAPKVLNLNEALEDMLTMMRRLIGEEIALDWQPTPDLDPVKMDPSQLHQVLANLVVNAREAISGVGRITIRTGHAELTAEDCRMRDGFEPGRYVLLTVSDDGCGMSQETLGHLFEPFFTTKPRGHGSGLGLATVYGVVKQNQGFIEVSSAMGKGTTVSIYLPRSAREESAPAVSAEPADPPRGAETVLLVEDEGSLLLLARKLVEQLGYTVLASDGPVEALRVAEAYPGRIDLLMTDVIMPDMSGRELSDRLLAMRPGIKSLFMSGYPADVIAHHGVLDEGVQFLAKPFSQAVLAAKLRAVLSI